MDIALDVIRLKDNGKDIKEIREWIEEEYSKLGYPATDTPPVE
ncbi:MAG: hypothetical protein IBX61_04320 [Thermoleophilia bacterium]|nr:hypothetical protein [Thermoleophilia bacterium]